jgi:ATP dependent DNA ligase C terminal region
VIPTRLRTPAAPLVCSVAEDKSKLNSSQFKKQKSRNDTLAACRSQAARPVAHAAGRLGRIGIPPVDRRALSGAVYEVSPAADIGGEAAKKTIETCAKRETLPIAGFAMKDNQFDGIYMGRQKGNSLVYAGKVDHGFDRVSAKDLQARLKPLIRKTQPYAKKIAHRGIWVEPSLLAEIEYRAKSAEGKVRHAFFKGIREDL